VEKELLTDEDGFSNSCANCATSWMRRTTSPSAKRMRSWWHCGRSTHEPTATPSHPRPAPPAVQNANAIASPLTHGFPSITAFTGLMWALERKLAQAGMPLQLRWAWCATTTRSR
jgi:hypothetical protein